MGREDVKEWFFRYWAQAIFGCITAGLGWVCRGLAKRINKQAADQKALKEGTQALLRNEIIRVYERYINQRWMPLYARENVLSMYGAYHALGGNGAVTQLMDELKALPSNKEDR
jgi:hypothetical protein